VGTVEAAINKAVKRAKQLIKHMNAALDESLGAKAGSSEALMLAALDLANSISYWDVGTFCS
jgi:hypothetical protein